MNKVACDESKAAEAEPEKLIAEVATKQGSNSIIKVQKAWWAFAEAEAERNAEWFTGGSIASNVVSQRAQGPHIGTDFAATQLA
jgi:hypothetical protein